nr:ribonuclease H-like domain-containing protein [Tanacetum cinerariifolium]
MRVKQYFLMTDYSLWEVILNGDSPVPTRVVEGVFQPVAPITSEQRLAQKNELKAHGTLLMALPDKHQVKFNSHKDAKTLMEAIKKRFRGNTETKKVQKTLLKQQFKNFTGSSSEGTTSQNLDFVSSSHTGSTTDSVSAIASVSAVCAKLPASSPPNVDSLSNAVLYSLFASQSTNPQLDNEDLKQIDVDDLEEMDLRWQMAMLTMRARRFLQKTGINLGANGRTSMGFDMSKVECFNCHQKRHFARECRSPKDSRRVMVQEVMNGVIKQRRSLQTMHLWLFHPTLLLIMRFQPSAGYHVIPPPYTRTFMPPKPALVFNIAPTAVETDHHAFNVQLSPTKPEQDLHTVQPIETSISAATLALASSKSTSSGKRRNRKTCIVCKSVDHLIKDCDYHAKKMAQPTQRTYAHRGNHKQYALLTHQKPQQHMVPIVVLTQSKPVLNTVIRPVSAAVPRLNVTRPRLAHLTVTKSKSPIRRHITRSPSLKTSNSPPRVTTAQALVGNPQYALKDNGVINNGCSRHMTRNMSYLFDFEELNGGYVAFGGNPKGGKISSKGKIKTCKLDFKDVYFVKELKFNLFSVSQMCDKKNSVLFTDTKCLVLSSDFKLPDESQVLLRVPRENNMYNVNLQNIVPSGYLTCLFAKETIDDLTYDPLGKFEGKVDEGFLVRYSVNSKAFRVFNSRTRIVQKTLLVNYLENKPNVACSGPTWLFDIDSLTRTMNYQLVIVGNQTNPSAGFQEKFDAEKAGEEIDQQYVLFRMWSSGFINPQNNKEDVAFDGKEHDFDAKKPESEVILSPRSSGQSRKQDDRTKKEAKGKSHVESFIGYRDLTVEFEDCYDNSSIKVNAVGSIVPTFGPTYGKSSFTDASQLLDDSDMPELEEITYSNDEDVVGAEADFNNLESSILVSPIPTTRIHKDHLVSQIIGDLSSTTQTRSMTRVVKDQDSPVPTRVVKGVLQPVAPTTAEQKLARKKELKARGELTFFLGLQVKQKKDGIFISQDKCVAKILRKFRLTEGKSASIQPLLKDPDGEDVDVHTCMSMIGSLMYLTSSRPEIMFADNDVTRLQALVDQKKVVITKAIIREVLRLDDADGVDSLPNEEIFAVLARMGKGFLGVEIPLFEGMIVGQVIEERGAEEEHVEDDTAAQGDDTTAQRDDAQEPSIPSPTPPPQPPQYLPSTS